MPKKKVAADTPDAKVPPTSTDPRDAKIADLEKRLKEEEAATVKTMVAMTETIERARIVSAGHFKVHPDTVGKFRDILIAGILAPIAEEVGKTQTFAFQIGFMSKAIQAWGNAKWDEPCPRCLDKGDTGAVK